MIIIKLLKFNIERVILVKIGPSFEMEFMAQNTMDWVKRPKSYSSPREIKLLRPRRNVMLLRSGQLGVRPVSELVQS